MADRRKLGRGLSTLIPTERPDKADTPVASVETPTAAPADLPSSALRDVPVESIEPNPHQPRQHFDEESLEGLAQSIAQIGVLQPLLVRETGPGRYELIAGERRWRAAQRAKVAVVPVVVREADEIGSVEQALVENLHREDLTALEESAAYQQLVDDFGLTHDQVARRVGKSRAAVSNALRLLQLPPTIQGFLADGRLSAGHARALLSCPEESRESLAARAVRDGWSVRALEDIARSGADDQGRPVSKPTTTGLKPAGLLELEKMLADFLDTRVSVSLAGKRGRISIDFADLVDLERIYRRMTEEQD